MIVLEIATSEVAASILLSGRTTHSRFNIPLEASETSMCNISKQSAEAKLIRKAKLIIWDEAPMTEKYIIESVDRTLRDIMDCPHPFGGKVIVFGGDFRQVLPVLPKGTRQQTVAVSLRKSYLWEKMHKIQLKKNIRAYDDTRFADFILRVGDGNESIIKDDIIKLLEDIVVANDSENDAKGIFIRKIYLDLELHVGESNYVTNRAILATTIPMLIV
ncbi:ATP-dependent DNA helicase PIF1-like [Cucumis melo var. makuwa]|nr:ATP-dependent DNA helicase PIF1-like [Cucumis melo var. makuwa]